MTSHEFVKNLHEYIYFITSGKENLLSSYEFTDEELQQYPLLFLYYRNVLSDETVCGRIMARVLLELGSMYLLYCDEKFKGNYKYLKSIANDRKNIKSMQNSIQATMSLLELTGNPQMQSRLKIVDFIFDMFQENDEKTIELICFIEFLLSIGGESDNFFENTLRLCPELADRISSAEDIKFLASLGKYFDGYRLTEEMMLHSLAIKLYNYPYYVFNNSKLTKAKLAKLVENLLSPFSRTEKFRVLPARAENYYIKSYYGEIYILSYAGKRNADKFSRIFNPEKFFTESHGHDFSLYLFNRNIILSR